MSAKRINRLARRLPVLSLLAILVIGLIAIRSQGSFREHLRRAVVWELSRSLGRRVRVEECRPSLLLRHWRIGRSDVPTLLRLNITSLRVEQVPGPPSDQITGPPFLTIPDLSIDLRLGSLVTGKGLLPSLHGVKAVRPGLNIVRDAEGRWNFSDLLAPEAAPPAYLAARIEVVDGSLVLQDFSPPEGLARPQSNHIENLDLSLFASRSPESDTAATRLQLRLSGVNQEDRFSHIFVSGQSLNYPAASAEESTQDRFNGSLVMSGADLGYLWQYGALASDLEITRGRGDITGYFLVNQDATGPDSLDYALTISRSRAELELPWVRGEAHEVSGLVRIGNGLVQFADLKGRLGDTRVKGKGYLVADSAPNSSSVQCHRFDFCADEAQGRDIARILPSDIAPSLSRTPGKGALSISIIGSGSESAFFGIASIPRLNLVGAQAARQDPDAGVASSVTVSELPEVQDVKADFIYSERAFAATGQAAAMGGEVEGAIFLPPSGKARFAASLADANLASAPHSVKNTLTGEVWGNLCGEFSLHTERSRAAPTVAGDIALVNGEVRSGMSKQRPVRFPFESLSTDFSYTKGEILISRARAETGYGLINLVGGLSADDKVEAHLEGRGIDLGEVGSRLGQDVSGTAFFSARLSGTKTRPQAELWCDIFAGEIRGYEYDWLRGGAVLHDKEVPHFDLVFQRGSGEGRFSGRASLPTKASPGEMFAQGRIEKARLEEWLPKNLRKQAKGVFDSDIEIRGSPKSPEMMADIHITRPQFAGMQFDLAEGNLRYDSGVLSLPFFTARVDGSQFAASGVMKPEGHLDFDFSAERLGLAALLRSHPSVPVDGWLSLQGRVQGKRDSPRIETQLSVEQVTLAGRPAGDVDASISWDDPRLAIESLDFAARGGRIRLSGDLTRAAPSTARAARSWQTNLKADVEGMEMGLLLDLIERGLRSRIADGYRPPVLATLARIPRPVRGFLTSSVSVSGPPSALNGEVNFVLSDASLAGEHLPSLEGEVGFAPHQLALKSVVAKEQDAYAEARGEIHLTGDTNLDIDVHNLRAEVLSPWVEGVSGLGGSADIYLQIMGPTRQPTIRGDLEVAEPTFANTHLERVKIDRFVFSGDRLDIENLRLVKGPHLASISASLPYSWRKARLEEEGPLWVELSLKRQDLAFASALWPHLGEFAGPLNAKFRIGGSVSSPRLEEGFAYASGQWSKEDRQAQITLESRVIDHSLQLKSAQAGPGLVLDVGRALDGGFSRQGKFTASGSYDPFAGPRRRWGLGRYDIALAAERLEANMGRIIRGQMDANLVLRGEPNAAREDMISGEARISRAKVTLPREKMEGEISWKPWFSPHLDIEVRTEDMEVSTRMARVEFSGQGIIGGRLGYEPLAVDMKFRAKRGVLDFPTALAEVQKMDVTVTKEPGEPLRALGHVEATARVGRYRVDLTGGGLLFPDSELRIVATATPPLSEAHATALLLGVPPAALGATGAAGPPAEQALGEHVAQSLSTSVTSIAATGLSAPLLRAAGLNELSFDISPVATRLQLGKRLAKKIYIYYLSSLSGATRSTLLRTIFDITPEFSVGVSINEQEQHTFEIQNTRAF